MPHISAAPASLKLGGQEYKLYPLKDVDYEEINNWLRGQFLAMIQQSLKDMTGPARNELLQAATLAARKLTFQNATDTEFDLEKITVMAKMIQQGLQPTISVDAIKAAFVASPVEAGLALTLWQELNVPQDEESAPQGPPKAEKSSRKTKSTHS